MSLFTKHQMYKRHTPKITTNHIKLHQMIPKQQGGSFASNICYPKMCTQLNTIKKRHPIASEDYIVIFLTFEGNKHQTKKMF